MAFGQKGGGERKGAKQGEGKGERRGGANPHLMVGTVDSLTPKERGQNLV